MEKVSLVNALRDDEARVWVATRDDARRLATEAGSRDGRMRKVHSVVPELLGAKRAPVAAWTG